MRQIRIGGLVRMADQVRRELAEPLAPAGRGEVLRRIQHLVGQVDTILQQHGMSFQQLPAPSRRAYVFLRQLASDTSQLNPPANSPPNAPAPRFDREPRMTESVRFTGLSSFQEDLLDDIAIAISQGHLHPQRMLGVIQSTCERLDHIVEMDKLDAAHLKPASRNLLTWFRWISQPEEFSAYVAAVARAQRILGERAARSLRWSTPLLIHFRLTGHLYQWRPGRSGTRIVLPAPMTAFSDSQLDLLGRWMCKDNAAGQAVLEIVHGPEYLSRMQAIEDTVGTVERTDGIVHDLAASFGRVNEEYFAGAIVRPRLTWTRRLTGCVFGRYYFASDTVSISGTLDQPHVPTFVVDHVMHHELLHKKHGIEWRDCRRHAHTPAFRAEERLFREFPQAGDWLERLAREYI
jgi:hypothetical protein